MILENNPVLTQQIINRCIKLNEYLKELQKTFVFDELDKNSFENIYLEILENIAKLNNDNYQDVSHIKKLKKTHGVINETIEKHEKSSHGEKIMVNCLKVDACLKTIYKALLYDEDHVDGFCNDYLWIIEDAIGINWKNHVVGEDVSREEFHNIVLNNSNL